MMNNKRLIGLLFIIILITIFNGCESQAVIKSNSEFKIFVTNDIHYIANSITDNSEGFKEFCSPSDGKQLLYIDSIMDAFADTIKEEKPEMLIISGDLTCNGAKESHLELANRLHKIEKLGTKVFVVPGNHDILNMWSRGFKDGKQYQAESIEQKEFEVIYQEFGYKEAIARDGDSLSYLAAPSEDIWLLMLDTNEYIDGNGMPSGRGIITDKTLEWVEECANAAYEKDAKIIAVLHHNLLRHHETNDDRSRVKNHENAVETFSKLGIQLSLTGHIHVQDIVSLEANHIELHEISTTALSMYPLQYGVINYSTEGLEYTVAKLDIEKWAIKNDIKDDVLLGYDKYLEESFFDLNYERAFSELLYEGGSAEETSHEVALIVADIMLKYYEGTVREVVDDLSCCPGYLMLLQTESDFIYDLVYSIMQRAKDNSIHLEIPY